MSVTQYTIGCGYELLKLKDTVFFLSKNQLKTINIDNGEAYATFVNQSPQPPSPNRLKGFNVKLTESDSLDERYKFTKQLTMSITGHLTDSQFLMDDDFYIVVQTEDGTYYLVNVDFPSKMTYTYNLSEGQNQTDFTFTSNSNHPTLKLNWNPVTWNTCQTYQVFGIDGLKLLEKDYTTIDAEQGVINLFDGNEFKNVDFLKNTISLQESYDGDITTTTISFEIPFNNYKPSWQYNLLEFDQNLYAAHITPKNSESGIFAGYEHGLQPSYEVNGSTSDGESATIKITLVEASNWGIFEFDTWSYYRDSSKRWIGIDSEVKCIGLGVGINTLIEEFDANGTPLGRFKCLEGYESVYTNYNIVGTYTEDEVESFRTSRCTVFRTRGAAPTGLYTCINGDKYELLVTSISYDGGKAWINSDDYTVGEMVESASSYCEIEPEYEWRLSEEWDCRPQLERWIPSGTTCVGVDKYNYAYKQVSDDGVVWYNPSPMEWSATTLIQAKSEECGFSARTVSTATTCLEYDLYSVNEYQESYDFGQTWATVSSSTGTLIEEDSEDCGYHPPKPSGVYKFYGIDNNGGTTELMYNSSGSTCSETGIIYNAPQEIFFCRTDVNKFMYFGDYVTSTIQESSTSSISGSSNVRYIEFNDLLQSFGKNFHSSPINRIVLPNNLVSFSSSMKNCDKLSEIQFPTSLVHLSLKLENVPKLKRLTIPKNVSEFIGFPIAHDTDNRDGYGSVEEIYFESKIPPQLEQCDGCTAWHLTTGFTTTIYVPQESVNLYKQAWESYFKWDDVDKRNLIQGYNSTADTRTYTDSFKYKVTENGTTRTVTKSDAYVFYEITSATTRIDIGDSVKSVYLLDTRSSGSNIALNVGSNVKRLKLANTSTGVAAHVNVANLPNGLVTLESGGATLPSVARPSSIFYEDIAGGVNFENSTNAQIVIGGQSNTKTVTIGNSVRILGGFNYLETENYTLSSVTIGNNVGYIQRGTFSGCRVLSSITLPSSVEVIGRGVLESCGQLRTVTCLATTPPYIDPIARASSSWKLFNNCSNLTAIYVPAASVDAYKASDGWKTRASIIQGI